MDWQSGLIEENDFWERALGDPERHWKLSEYRERTDPNLELQAELQQLIPAAPGSTVRILDVGSGPLTRIGKKWSGRTIEITATDPLAEKYAALVKKLGVPQLVPVLPVHAEKLVAKFPANHFDLAYASNCLDHAYDPVQAIRQMLELVKLGHFVYLWHFANVGITERYTGLHQWNFDVKGNDFLISNGQVIESLKQKIGAAAELSCEVTHAFDCRVVIARLKKLAR